MMANAAFVLGLALDLADDADDWSEAMPFRDVERNFYRAAQLGPDATLAWPAPSGEIVHHDAASLAASLVDRARRGLEEAGLGGARSEAYLRVFLARAERRTSGARWQRRRLREVGHGFGSTDALDAMFAEYRARSQEGSPVHTWGQGA
jgi:hypothetical protein